MANPIAVPGTVVSSGAAVSPGGAQGPTALSANANNKATLGTDSLLLVQGTAAGVAATTHAQTVSGDDPQLTNARTPTAHEASHVTGSDQIPLASSSTKGLLDQTSGNTSDYVGGDNACHSLDSAFPAGMVVDFAGGTAPTGWLLCDGTSYLTTTYPNLFGVIHYTYGGSGANFNVPDLRGRSSIGVGQGAGLTTRALASTGGAETVALAITHLPAHNHGVSETPHAHSYQTPLGGTVNFAQGANYTATSTTTGSASTGLTTTNTGSGTAHANMQPFITLNKIIKI